MVYTFCKKIKNKLARSFYTYLVEKKIGKCNRLHVNHRSSVTKLTKLGTNVNFNGMKISGLGIVNIGNNFHSGSNCQIMTHYHNYDNGNKIPYDNTYIVENVTIGDNVWLGNNVIILPGVTIGEGAIIQAGSVVVSNIEELAIAGGHPAKVFKYRDKEHYYKLKQAHKFF